MNIGLFLGSFNPIHIGHLIIANHFAEYTNLDEIWLVVSPQNPFKKQEDLLQDTIRLEMVQIALSTYPKLKASDFEFTLSKPSYTIDTLNHLEKKYPQHSFSLIMGMDNLEKLNLWKNYEQIIAKYCIYVYPRPGYQVDLPFQNTTIQLIDNAPLMQISATYIRESIRQHKNVHPLLPPEVASFLDKYAYYKQA